MTVERVDHLPENEGSARPVQKDNEGNAKRVLDDILVILDVSLPILLFLIQQGVLTQVGAGTTSLGFFTSKAIVKISSYHVSKSKKIKNGAEKTEAFLFWINIITNIALSTLVVMGKKDAFLSSCIMLGLNSGSRLVSMFAKRSCGRREDQYDFSSTHSVRHYKAV